MKRVYSTVLTVIFLALLGFFSGPALGSSTIQKDSDLRVLLFSGTGWYLHPGIPEINGWLVRLGAKNDMQIDVSETGRDISKEKLEKYDVLILNNANVLDKVFSEEQRKAIEDWYSAGGGIVALHAVWSIKMAGHGSWNLVVVILIVTPNS